MARRLFRGGMLIGIAILLAVLWLIGVASSYTLGGLIHLLLAFAILAGIAAVFTSPRSS